MCIRDSVGSNKQFLEPYNRTPIEAKESLDVFLEITFVDLEQIKGNKRFLKEKRTQAMTDGSYLVALKVQSLLQENAESNMDNIIETILTRHQELKKLNIRKRQESINSNQRELDSLLRKTVFLEKQIQLQDLYPISSIIQNNLSATEALGFNSSLELETMMKLKNTVLTAELSLLNLLKQVESLIIQIDRDTIELAMPNFVATKLFAGVKPSLSKTSTHNVLLNLIFFALAGLLISSFVILLRHFYLISVDKKS